VKRFADAMLIFGAGSLAGLASAFFAYISRTFRLERRLLLRVLAPLNLSPQHPLLHSLDVHKHPLPNVWSKA